MGEDERLGPSQPYSPVEEEPWGGYSKPSHFFQLEDYPDTQPAAVEGSIDEDSTDNVAKEESSDKSDEEERSDASMRATWLYEVNNSTEGSLEEDSKKEVTTEGVTAEE